MKKILLILFLVLPLRFMAQSHLSIMSLTGDEQQYTVALIGKIVFEDDAVVLYDNDGVILGSTDLELIDKIIFATPAEVPTSMEHAQPTQVAVFPNPTQDRLIVRGVEDTQTVRVFSMQGQLLLSVPVTNGEAQVQVSGLPDNAYLLQVGAQVVKFIKE